MTTYHARGQTSVQMAVRGGIRSSSGRIPPVPDNLEYMHKHVSALVLVEQVDCDSHELPSLV